MDQPEIQRLTYEAFRALREDNPVRALALADQLVAAVPDDPVARTLRTHALLRQGTREEACEEARRAVELSPHDENSQLMLGIAAWHAGRLSLAQQSLERAVQLSGRKPFFLEEYAWFMVSERGPRPARDAAQAAVDADNDSSTAWATLGLALFRLHRWDEAEKALRRALELEPGNVRAQSAMLRVFQEKGQVDRAAALADVMEDNPAAKEIVRSVREDERRRRLHQAMLQRPAILQSVVRVRRSHRWLALAAGLVTVALLVALLRPSNPWMVAVFCVVPLLLLWRLIAFIE